MFVMNGGMMIRKCVRMWLSYMYFILLTPEQELYGYNIITVDFSVFLT